MSFPLWKEACSLTSYARTNPARLDCTKVSSTWLVDPPVRVSSSRKLRGCSPLLSYPSVLGGARFYALSLRSLASSHQCAVGLALNNDASLGFPALRGYRGCGYLCVVIFEMFVYSLCRGLTMQLVAHTACPASEW